jgi:hypothetical protein
MFMFNSSGHRRTCENRSAELLEKEGSLWPPISMSHAPHTNQYGADCTADARNGPNFLQTLANFGQIDPGDRRLNCRRESRIGLGADCLRPFEGGANGLEIGRAEVAQKTLKLAA